MKEKILEVKNLEVSFKTYAGISHAVRGIDFNLHKGETLAIVGESGCGKTVSSKAIMRLLPESNTIIGENSEVLFHGEDLLKKSENGFHSRKQDFNDFPGSNDFTESDHEDRRSDCRKYSDP